MSTVNFKLLHIFIAIAENRSFRRASEQLNRSQSAVSMQVKQLEEQIGVALFHRTTRRVELTAEGLKLLAYARRALAEWDNGLKEIREAVEMQRGTLSFACIPTIAASTLPRIIREFQEIYPGINISLRELASEDLLDSIRQKEVDFGIGVTQTQSTEFAFRHLFEDPIFALAADRFGTKSRSSIELRELCKFPLLVNSKSTALRKMLEDAFAERDLAMDIKFEVAHTHTLVGLAEAGVGIGILPKSAVPPLRDQTLTALRITAPRLVRSVSVVTLKGQSLSPAARAMAGMIEGFLSPQRGS